MNGSLAEAYRQNWERLQHVDRQRMAFTNLYAVIVGGLLALVASKPISDLGILFGSGFLFILSLFGFLLNLRVNDHVNAYETKIKELAEQMGIGKFSTRGANEESKITLRRLYLSLQGLGTLVFYLATVYLILNRYFLEKLCS